MSQTTKSATPGEELNAILEKLNDVQRQSVIAYAKRLANHWSAGPLPDALVPHIDDEMAQEITSQQPGSDGILYQVEDHEGKYREYRRSNVLKLGDELVETDTEILQVWALKGQDGALVRHERIGVVGEYVASGSEVLEALGKRWEPPMNDSVFAEILSLEPWYQISDNTPFIDPLYDFEGAFQSLQRYWFITRSLHKSYLGNLENTKTNTTQQEWYEEIDMVYADIVSSDKDNFPLFLRQSIVNSAIQLVKKLADGILPELALNNKESAKDLENDLAKLIATHSTPGTADRLGDEQVESLIEDVVVWVVEVERVWVGMAHE